MHHLEKSQKYNEKITMKKRKSFKIPLLQMLKTHIIILYYLETHT